MKKGITLVLGGGGARGIAHIGVLEVLEENNIPIKRIIGTSAGAFVGACYAAGKLEEFKKVMNVFIRKKDVFSFFFSMPSLESMFNGKKMDAAIYELTKDLKIEDLKIPFAAVAFDLIKGERVVFDKGDLFTAVRASVSIPGVFKPLKWGDSILIDGGVTDAVPTEVAKMYKDDMIVAVSLSRPHSLKGDTFNFLKVMSYAAEAETRELSRIKESYADVIIKPNSMSGTFAFEQKDELIKEGRKATLKVLPQIIELLKKGEQ
jgi:NTE family protein